MLGKQGVARAFGRDDLPIAYWIGRTGRHFPDRTPGQYGEDSFPLMAARGLPIIDRMVRRHGGHVTKTHWHIPPPDRTGI